MKPDPLTGKDTEYLLVGQELAIYIAGEGGHNFCFMDARLKGENVKIGEQFEPVTIDFTLQDLVGHFEIPEVPDVAQCNPDGYLLNRSRSAPPLAPRSRPAPWPGPLCAPAGV